MAWLGMNLDTVQGELPKWENLSEEINDVITKVQAQVTEADANWNGQDSEQFVQEWSSTHQPALVKIKALIDNLVQQLNADIQQQTEASNS